MDAVAADGAPRAVTRADLQSRAVRGGLASALQAFVSIPLGLASTAVVARVLGPVDFGTLAFLTLLLANGGPILDFGFSSALNQFGVQAEATGQRSRTVLLIRSRIGFTLLVPAPVLSLGAAYLLRHEPWWAALAVLLVMYASAFVSAGSEALYLQNRSASIALLATVTGLVTAASSIAVVLLTRDPVRIWLVRLALTLVMPTAALVLVNRSWGWRWMCPRLPRKLPKGFWRFASFSGFAGVTGTLVFSRSEVYAFRYHHLLTELGLYALAFGIAQQLLAPLDVILAPLAPAQSAMVYGHPEHALRSMLRSTAVVATACGALVATTPFIGLAFPLIFGDRFRPASALFVVLAIGASSKTLLGPVVVSFNARRRGAVLAVAPAVALVVDLGFAFLTVVPFGAWGAVIANVLGQSLVLFIYVHVELRHYERPGLPLVRACLPWLLGVLSAGAGALVLLVPGGQALHAVLVLATSGTVYIILIRLFGRAARKELSVVLAHLPSPLRRPAAIGLKLLGVPR